jgi:hypothetical protein
MGPDPKGRRSDFERMLDSALQGGETGMRAWTAADTGGFQYVLFSKSGNDDAPGATRGLSQMLGAPFYDDRLLALWAVPGVGLPPPGLPRAN